MPTQKSFRIREGRAAELPPAHTRGLQLGGVTCGTLDRRSRAPDMRHYLLMACQVGGPNLVANSAGFEIYRNLQVCTSQKYKSQVLLRYTYVNII